MEKQIKDSINKIMAYHSEPMHLILEGACNLSKKAITEEIAKAISPGKVLVITVRPVILKKLQDMYQHTDNIHCMSLKSLLKNNGILSSYEMLIVDDTESFVVDSKTYSISYHELYEEIECYAHAVLWFTLADVYWQDVLKPDGTKRRYIKLRLQETTKLFSGTYITFSNEMEKIVGYMKAKLQSGEKIIFISDKVATLEEIGLAIDDDFIMAVPRRFKKAKLLYEEYGKDLEYIQHTGLLPENKKVLLIHADLAQVWQLKDSQVKTVVSDYVDVIRLIRYLQNICVQPKKKIDLCLYIAERKVIKQEHKKGMEALTKAAQLSFNEKEFLQTVKAYFRDTTGMLYARCNRSGEPIFAVNFCEFYRYIYLKDTGYINSQKQYKHLICSALGTANALELVF